MSNSFWGSVKTALLNVFKQTCIKHACKRLIIAGGFKKWLVTFVIEELIETADEELITPAFIKVGYTLRVKRNEKIYHKLANAEDVNAWRDAVNDV